MKMDLINYTALAVKIQSEIEKILGNSVNLNTIVVAIKRYADSFEIKEEIKEEFVLKNARLALTDGIMDVRFSIKDSNQMDPMAILDKFSIVFQKEKICLVQVLQKLEFQYLVHKINQMWYHMLQKYYMLMV
jgi:hypothetical protein